MINEEVLSYVRARLAANIPKEQIAQELATTGWRKEDIDAVLAASVPPPSVPQMSPGEPVADQSSVLRERASKWLPLFFAIIIGVLVALGITSFGFNDQVFAIFREFIDADQQFSWILLPSTGAAIIFTTISWLWGRRIYMREGHRLHAFLFGTAVYLIFSFITLGGAGNIMTGFIRTVAPDLSFAVGLVFSISFQASIYILFVGLVLTMILLLVSLRGTPEGPEFIAAPRTILSRYATILVAILLSCYAFSVFASVASVTNQQWLCGFVYSTEKKGACFRGTSATAGSADEALQSTSGTGEFITVDTKYRQISDLYDIGGKLAYVYENFTNTSKELETGIVLDGQVVSGAYKKLGIMPIAAVDGRLAYEAYKGEKQIIVFDGKEYGEEYDMVLRPTDVGGKLAYLARRGATRPNVKQFVVWDGKEYGIDFDFTNNIRDIGGKLAYHGTKGESAYIVVGDAQYGPYEDVYWLQEYQGHSVSQVRKNGKEVFVVDGVVYGENFDSLYSDYTFIDGKFAFAGSRDGDVMIAHDGKEYGPTASNEMGPYNVNGELGYLAWEKESNTAQLIIGGRAVGPKFTNATNEVAVSEGGKVAIKVGDREKTVYVDGEEVYTGEATNLGFIGEKLIFFVKENNVSAIWYDGKKIGQGFAGYNYMTLVDGKLVIAAFASTGEGITYSLLVEQ